MLRAPNPMKLKQLLSALALLALVLSPAGGLAQQPGPQKLPTGMEVTPLAVKGSSFQELNPGLPELPQFTADHPITTALSPDGKTLLVLTSGYNTNFDNKGKAIPALSNEYVFVYDVQGSRPVKRQVLKISNSYAGLVWALDGSRFFVSGGPDDNVHVFKQAGSQWKEAGDPIALGHKAPLGLPGGGEGPANRPIAAGLAVSGDGNKLLVANFANDSVSLVDVHSRKKAAELDLRPGKGAPGGEYPYWVAFKGNDRAYVSSLRDREIVELDLSGTPKVNARIKVHGQPGKMVLNRAQTLLFAVCDNSDLVVMVDTRNNRVVAEIRTTAPVGLLPETKKIGFKGSNPNGLALSPDEGTLYVTNGGTNSVAVISVEKDPDDSRVVGLIPAAWYPTSVSVSQDGATLFVTNAKSIPGPNPRNCRSTLSTASERPCAGAQQFIWQLEKGGLTSMPRPDASALAALTRQSATNNHFVREADEQKDQELFAALRKKIKHVIYIVKENRTYDQVLGDLEKGNGDPELTLFPEPISPNHHELARRFVTLDNFYDSGEVSGNGWNWSTAARATDLTERSIPLNYARRGVGYDVEGVNRGINVAGSTPEERNTVGLSDAANQLPGTADVAAPDGPKENETGAGYLWDAALRANVSLRNYGFFIDLSRYFPSPQGRPMLPLLHYPATPETRVAFPTKTSLKDVTDPYFRGFDMRYADYWRFKEWEREFDDYVEGNYLPRLELVRICHDHLGSFAEAIDGVNTVETQFADNDYALGRLVDKVASSRYAKDTLIFVVEDDAQNGPDHVDAHRSIAYVIGPYVKQGAVISQHYTTVSMLRTIEELLGIPPLGLNDAFQRPMSEVFDLQQQDWTYTARVPGILRTTRLPLPRGAKRVKTIFSRQEPLSPAHDAAYWAEKTRGFDFSAEDQLDSAAFNLVLWNGLKGNQPYPMERDGRDLRKNRRQLLQSHVEQHGP